VLVFDSGVVGVTEAVTSLDPTLLDEGWPTDANVRIPTGGLKAERDAARRRDEEERRAAIA
jgi:hypothetical protein